MCDIAHVWQNTNAFLRAISNDKGRRLKPALRRVEAIKDER
jgi:hypothetical protein